MKFTQNQLTSAAARILSAGGAKSDDAKIVAKRLVNGNLTGHDSHGVIRLCQYVDQLSEGSIKPGGELTTVADYGAVTILDADLGFGQIMAEAAVRKGVAKARTFGVSMIGLRNVAHVGRLGEWAELAAGEGVVSVHFVNSPARPAVAPFGGRERRMSTNPICVGIPVGEKESLIADMSTSSTAEGKLRFAHAARQAIPDGWIVDKIGNPSNDPNDFYDGGAMLPIGGHKGYALSLVVELFAGALSGGGTTDPTETVNRNNMMSLFIDPIAYGFQEEVERIAASYLSWISDCRATDPGAAVLIPGEPERKIREQRLINGIEVPDGVWRQIKETAKGLGLSEAQLLA